MARLSSRRGHSATHAAPRQIAIAIRVRHDLRELINCLHEQVFNPRMRNSRTASALISRVKTRTKSARRLCVFRRLESRGANHKERSPILGFVRARAFCELDAHLAYLIFFAFFAHARESSYLDSRSFKISRFSHESRMNVYLVTHEI